MEAETSEVKPTPENRERLAAAVMESMDIETLRSWAFETLYDSYGQIPLGDFQEEWEVYLGKKEGE